MTTLSGATPGTEHLSLYVLRWAQPRDAASTFQLVGPFDTTEDARDWATSEVNNPDDSPCWQVLCLRSDDLFRRIPVFTPRRAPLLNCEPDAITPAETERSADEILPGAQHFHDLIDRADPEDTVVVAVARGDQSARITRIKQASDILDLAQSLIQEALHPEMGTPLSRAQQIDAWAALSCLSDPDADKGDDIPAAHDPHAVFVGAQPPDGGADDDADRGGAP